MTLRDQVNGDLGRQMNRLFHQSGTLLAILFFVLLFSACRSFNPDQLPEVPVPATSSLLNEGDMLQITFPGATNLNTNQKIRRDGTINLPLIGDTKAAEKTLAEFQAEVAKAYESQLQSQEVNVSLYASVIPYYVTGSVLRSGKITSDRPLTVLEAIMEAGGFVQGRANLRKILVIRSVDGKRSGTVIDLGSALKGGKSVDTILQPNDIIFVPEKLQLF